MIVKKLILPIIILLSLIINEEIFAQDTTDYSEYLEDIVEKRESNHYWDLAEKSVSEGDKKMAIQYYDKAINSYPKNARIYIERGIIKAELEDLDGAIQDFTLAIKTEPHYIYDNESFAYTFARSADSEAYFYRGRTYFLKDSISLALDDITKSIDLVPSSSAYMFRGHLKIVMDSFSEAIDDYSKALELDPENPMYLFYRANAFFGIDKIEQACNDFRKSSMYDLGEENNIVVSGMIYEFCK